MEDLSTKTTELLAEEKKHTDATVRFELYQPSTDTREIAESKPLKINTRVRVLNHEARSFGFTTRLYIIGGPPLLDRSDVAYQLFWREVLPQMNLDSSVVVGENQFVWNTLGFDQISKADADNLKSLSSKLYIVSVAKWKNESGSESRATDCQILLNADLGYLPDNLVLHPCQAKSPY